ncbi:MAG: hypothetical protein UU88_C0001G0094 [Parcubacteria group bacterium GW2011_GWC1_42_11]|uniref:Uncharacterized protein n=1 Tax=Candidatus Nomurabacteria bacterium GW2011_GWC2_42_20 TaxID=1618756 RepID=A0A0G0ZFV5_9BACT|nr:MAG: hypothetical protein UU88_C0001G0094 [Parcubacteria group bacterium GW2011_GWC1_42_11]KKS47600.1 MAG: hypothetical protein UV12_C0006G0024 [Candidatus Nomurabacteria bacterium GW2011_GWC2_42_20]KKS58731.1 MAG: hypothetical protein UV24_C0017G0010 [Candidatus Nomurabacteria bacterium GW2011_GWA2_42_41]KKT09535.1 MAG: hypothetical protein UV86_C0005G0006 [Candidatus Nomurabacteria bacterium GW2011_GWB1_43_20]TAN35936.1 MAG: hypothetical protein EPN27_02785 [Patescibacteria group bacterium
MESQHYIQSKNTEISQGDIFRDLSFSYKIPSDDGDLLIQFPFPYAVVLTQACDLSQHYNQLKKNLQLDAIGTDEALSKKSDDKILDTILVCPAYPHEKFLEGQHIEERKMNDFDGKKGQASALKHLILNERYHRYHYLSAFGDDASRIFPEMIIDFKRFHTIPLEALVMNYHKSYLGSLRELYRERLSQRFSNYLSRIGLPDDQKE